MSEEHQSSTTSESVNTSEHPVLEKHRSKNCCSCWKFTCIVFCWIPKKKKNGRHSRYPIRARV